MAAFDVVPNSEHLIQRATELLFSVHPRPSGESIHLLCSDLPGTSQCSKRMQRVFAKSCSPLLVTFSHKGGAGVSDLQNGNDISFLPSQDALADRTLSWASELELALTSSAFFLPPTYCCDPLPFELHVSFEILSKSLFLRSSLWYVCNL